MKKQMDTAVTVIELANSEENTGLRATRVKNRNRGRLSDELKEDIVLGIFTITFMLVAILPMIVMMVTTAR